jgi:hypothetical protein
MPCDTRLKKGQTVSQRKEEVKKAVTALEQAIAARRVAIKINSQGAIAFVGLTEAERDGVTDACAYRRILATGSALARAEIARAEQIQGKVNRQIIGHGGEGMHSHDGGKTWHNGH